jgi:primosomal protein N'
MPTYTFECDEDSGGCGEIIEIRCAYAEKQSNKPKSCPKCKKRKSIIELFGSSNSIYIPKTLGSLVDKNTSKISTDEKIHLTKKHNEYKRDKSNPSVVEKNGKLIRNIDNG